MVSRSISLPSSGFFSSFPRGTCPLSVSKEYFALERGRPRFKQDFSCPVLLRVPARSIRFQIQDFHLLWSAFPDSSLTLSPLMRALQPRRASSSVWALVLSLATTNTISIDYFSSRYLDVSVPWVCSPCSTLLEHSFPLFKAEGLPHSDTSGSKHTCLLPGAFR
jgi:hypothetical protein